MSRRAPRPLALALDSLARDLEPATVLAECQRVWTEVAGPVIAAEARPESEHGGTLTIVCKSSVWASELDLMGPTLVASLNEALGRPALSRLRCVAGGGRRRT